MSIVVGQKYWKRVYTARYGEYEWKEVTVTKLLPKTVRDRFGLSGSTFDVEVEAGGQVWVAESSKLQEYPG